MYILFIITSTALASSVFLSGHNFILISASVFLRLQLSPERGFLPAASEKHELWGGALTYHPEEWMKLK